MFLDAETADHMLRAAVDAVSGDREGFATMLDELPAPIYVTDREGTVTYFNRAYVELAGRTPDVGSEKCCIAWKLYTSSGEALSRDRCPMARALGEQRPVSDVPAVAERPDGSRFTFVPHATPTFDARGNLVGAVNLLREHPEDYDQRRADIETLARMAARYAGRDPDERLRIQLAGIVVFDDLIWRYSDFVQRAEAAYEILAGPLSCAPAKE